MIRLRRLARMAATVAFAVGLMAGAQVASADPTCTLAGWTYSPNLAVARGVSVSVYQGATLIDQQTSDAIGAFSFALEPGTYTLYSDPATHNATYGAHLLPTWYEEQLDAASATPIELTAESPERYLMLRLAGLNRVHGTVSRADSPYSPLSDVAVEVYSADTVVATATTDGSGQFEAWVPDGSYEVRYDPSALNVATGSRFLSGWYSNALDRAHATSIALGSGVLEYNVTTALNYAGDVAGTVRAVNSGAVLEGIGVALVDDMGTTVATDTTDAGGAYAFNDIASGRGYTVLFDPTAYNSANPDQPYYLGKQPTDLDTAVLVFAGSTSLADVYLPALSIHGTVSSWEYGLVDPVAIELWDASGIVTTTASSLLDSSYVFYPQPGSYKVRLDPAEWNAAHPAAIPMPPKWLWSALTSATADWFVLSAEQPEQLADAQLTIKHLRVMAWGQSIGVLEGAHVRLFDGLGHEVASSTADADGLAEFSAVPDGELTVFLDTTEYNLIHGTELQSRWYKSNPSVAEPSVISVGWYESHDLTIMTAPPTRITGTLRVEENGSAGAVLEGVVVEAYDRWTDPLSVLASATTGADGTYAMQIPDDGRELILRLDSRARNESRTPAIRTGWWVGDSVTTYPDSATIFSVAQGQTYDASALMLQRTVAVGGIVRDSTGAVCSGVYVNGLLRPNAALTDEALLEQIASGHQQAQTDADGRFELDFAEVSADVLANIDGATVQYAPAEPSGLLGEYYSDRSTLASADAIPIAVGQRMAADATLTVGATVAGHVTDAWDRPVPNVAVYLKQLPSGLWSYRATTDQDGAYRALGLRAGEYEVRFDPENVMSTDPNDGSPLFYANQYWQDRLAEDDADALVVAESTNVTGIDCELVQAVADVAGHVRDTSGTPVEGAFVQLYRQAAEGEGDGGDAGDGWLPAEGYSASTDATGGYSLPRVRAGAYRLRFTAPSLELAEEWWSDRHIESLADTLTVTVAEDLESVDATLEAVGHLAGVVHDEVTGAPIAGAGVNVYASGASGWELLQQSNTDVDGSYTVRLTAEGPVRVLFGTPGAPTFSAGGNSYVSEAFDDQPDIEHADSIVASFGATVSADASLTPTARMSGRVEYDHTFGDVSVQLSRQTGASWQVVGTKLIESGSGSFSPDSDGDMVPDFLDPDPANPEMWADLALLNGDLDGDGVLNVSDPDIDGDGIANMVDPHPWESDGSIDGSWEFVGLVPGTYRVGFADARGYYLTQYFDGASTANDATPITLAAGQSRSSVDATMLAGGRISGTVDPLAVTEGDQMVSPRVAVYRHTPQGWVFVGVNDVADNGAFRQVGLVSGTYSVVAYTAEGGYVSEAYDNAAVPGFDGTAPQAYSPPAWVRTLAVTQGEDTIVPDEIVLQRADALDHAAPVSASDAPSGWVNHDVVVHLSAVDAAGAPFALYGAVGDNPLAPTSTLPTITAEGETLVRFLAEDAHGNREATRSATVRIDRTPPVTIDDHKAIYGSQAFIRMYGTDNLSGADELRYQLDGGAAVLGAAVVTTETGMHTLAYRSTDRAGNIEETRTITFQVGGAMLDISDDIVAPQSFAEAPSGWVRPSAVVTLTATDDEAGVEGIYYSTDGGQPRFRYFDPLEIAEEGTTVVRFRALDRAGNAEAIHSATVRVDGTAPVTTAGTIARTGAATATLSASDALSGVVRTEYRIDGGAVTSGTVVVFAPGAYSLQYRSEDAAGNAEEWRTLAVTVSGSTTLDCAVSASAVTYPAAVAVTGHLRDESGAGLGGAAVALQTSANGASWSTIRTLSSTDGTYAASVVLGTSAWVRLAFVGDARHDAATSAARRVTVAATLSKPAVPSKVKRKARFTATTTLRPWHANGPSTVMFRFYRKEGRRWVLRASVRGTNSTLVAGVSTRVKCSTKLSRTGSWKVIAEHRADAAHPRALSAASAFRVR